MKKDSFNRILELAGVLKEGFSDTSGSCNKIAQEFAQKCIDAWSIISKDDRSGLAGLTYEIVDNKNVPMDTRYVDEIGVTIEFKRNDRALLKLDVGTINDQRPSIEPGSDESFTYRIWSDSSFLLDLVKDDYNSIVCNLSNPSETNDCAVAFAKMFKSKVDERESHF
jgi:hypothetical protein